MQFAWRAALGVWSVAGALALSSGAEASKTPEIGPAPGWVRPAPDIPAVPQASQGLPFMILLSDLQYRFDAEGWTEYRESRVKIQSPEGLQALGALPFDWSPWSDTLTFHKLAILRDGQTLDLLPHDGIFTILRRETGLAQATLTGNLTALIQPEGLQVGDVLDMVISVRHAAPLMKGLPSAAASGWDQFPTARVRIEARWPSTLPLRWKQSDNLPKLTESDSQGFRSLTLSLEQVKPLVQPAQAPVRFLHGRELEFSSFQSWDDVARLMAPLYAKAAELPPGSAVAALAAEIAAKSSDPEVRAAEALKLVQSKVRYLAHAEAEGGYTPQTAEDTWKLRYGDCKAKTVLLLALLRELGAPAEPVLVNSSFGDALSQHLPAPLFDHVLVRVKLNGRDYWLDGAREGDRNLSELTVPAYGWVLPLGAPNAKLLHLEPTSPAKPMISEYVRYDASVGVTAPEPTQLRTVFRGDLGAVFHKQLAAIPPDRLNEALKQYWAGVHTAFTPAHMAAAWDPATGEETLTADGTSKLDWSGSGLELDKVAMGGKPDITRDPAAHDPDAPYQVEFPSWTEAEVNVVLPIGLQLSPGSAKAADFDKVIAGVAYHRAGSLNGNVFRVEVSHKSVQTEISAAEARAAVDPLTKLGEQTVFVPAGRLATDANNAKAVESQPTTASGHVRRGSALLDSSDFSAALAEYDAAIALDPKSQDGWAGRALAHAWLGDPTAYADADMADRLGKPEIVAARARGLIATSEKKYGEAKAYFRKALALHPEDLFSQWHMIEVDVASGDIKQAEIDIAAMVKAHPETEVQAHAVRAKVALDAHDDATGVREMQKIVPETPDVLLYRAKIYLSFGKPDLARADVDAAIKLKPSAEALVLRAQLNPAPHGDAARADMEAALLLDPGNEVALLWKVNEASIHGDYPEALKRISALIAAQRTPVANYLIGRAQIYARLKQTAEMNADFEALHAGGVSGLNDADLCLAEVSAHWKPDRALADCRKALDKDPTSQAVRSELVQLKIDLGQTADLAAELDRLKPDDLPPPRLNAICWALATHAVLLDRALAYCDAALKPMPDWATALDSRGFVLLRLGRNAEALAAYNAALKARSDMPDSLYGRSIAEERLGQTAKAQKDRKAALAARASVAADFEAWGVR